MSRVPGLCVAHVAAAFRRYAQCPLLLSAHRGPEENTFAEKSEDLSNNMLVNLAHFKVAHCVVRPNLKSKAFNT